MKGLIIALALVSFAASADYFRNSDPNAPWNDPAYNGDVSAPWNDPAYRNDPNAPWNDRAASPSSANDYLDSIGEKDQELRWH